MTPLQGFSNRLSAPNTGVCPGFKKVVVSVVISMACFTIEVVEDFSEKNGQILI